MRTLNLTIMILSLGLWSCDFERSTKKNRSKQDSSVTDEQQQKNATADSAHDDALALTIKEKREARMSQLRAEYLQKQAAGVPGYSPNDVLPGPEEAPEPLSRDEQRLAAALSGDPQCPSSDYNGDGVVDGDDLQVWQDNFGNISAGPIPLSQLEGNVNGSTSGVNGADFFAWQREVGFSDVANCKFPEPFNITGPVGPVDGEFFTLTWESSVGASFHNISVSLSPDCSDPLLSTTLGSTAQQIDIIVNLSPGVYHACVSAENQPGIRPANNHGMAFTVAEPEPRTIFVTFESLSIDDFGDFPPFLPFFSGARAADWGCTFYADNAGLFSGWNGEDIVYKAILSSSSSDAIVRMGRINGIIQNVPAGGALSSGPGPEQVAFNKADFFDGTIDANILTEFGALPPASLVWTGSKSDGFEQTGQTCGSWDDNFATGAMGDASILTGGAYMNNNTQGCTGSARLYCIAP